MIESDALRQALACVTEPALGRDVVSANLVEIVRDGEQFTVRYAPPSAALAHNAQVAERIRQVAIEAGAGPVRLEIVASAAQGSPAYPNIGCLLGVGAGKGGVGKSTVASNLAVALAQSGCRVGLLDADIYGPSVPILMGLRGAKPAVNAARKIVPAVAHGVKTVSIGFMVQDDMAVAWRGPMVGKAVTQLLQDVDWGDLDYLVVDLPPGTGDVVLSLCQAAALDGAVVVSTPQDVAFADVLRAVRMFSMLKVDVVGLVENMAYFLCPDNGKAYEIFGPSNSEHHCAAHDLTFLGRLPIELQVSPCADAGLPIVVAEPDSELCTRYKSLAADLALRLVRRKAAIAAQSALGEGFFTVHNHVPSTAG
ncbi:MAG: Mrp/NBP35 family ATP-binding protein [Deltaproteobacteria bacterium]|nr:Mrp/NBP35 family ATP-binding protein [Deltaproteobacteria bacterium]